MPIQILQAYIRQGRLTGSYLFMGEEGLGKKLIAKTLAQELNCENHGLNPCGSCSSCLKIEKGQHPDVHCLDAEDSDSIKIEDIRQIQKEISLRPYIGEKKVFILNDAHNLTAEAANALLKILEEPPGNSLIILISSKPALLFKTIISRCKILRFYPMPRLQLEEALKEDFRLDNNLAHFLAYFCEGRFGRALKLKDTDILREKNMVIDGFVLGKRPSPGSLPADNRNSIRDYLNILAGWFRDIYFAKVGISQNELINLDRKDELLKCMSSYTAFDLEEILNCICDSLLYLEQNINSKLLLSNLRWSLKGAI
ncbi:MAG: DNA polymerase III subunit delta' [Candidatus Omnitrophica bacterium]|nr:DNA polymerase III subunit delta' [Candidatus Omnitrophota bacterium]MDD5592996.1 DNA polymerase III subunit delta' [Candidatus Omnitrophota bacterium]